MPDHHRRPPGRGLRALLLFAMLLLLAPSAWAGSIVTREFRSEQLGRAWRYNVYLPDGYDGGTLRYPVLYLLHGNGGSLNEWPVKGNLQATADRLIRAGEIPPAVIILPDAGTTWYVDRKEKMESAFFRDLIPDAEKSFRVLDTREGRLIGGLSMGGYGTLRFVMLHPEMFAAAALLSPAIYDPEPPENSSARRVGVFGAEQYDPAVWKSLNWPTLWDGFLERKIAVPMYINSGDDDDFFIEGEAVRLYDRLRRAGQPAQLRIVDGAHVWPVWESTIGDAMRYVFSFASRPVIPAP
jgi:S-formylglutathione hydrolase FrmB